MTSGHRIRRSLRGRILRVWVWRPRDLFRFFGRFSAGRAFRSRPARSIERPSARRFTAGHNARRTSRIDNETPCTQPTRGRDDGRQRKPGVDRKHVVVCARGGGAPLLLHSRVRARVRPSLYAYRWIWWPMPRPWRRRTASKSGFLPWRWRRNSFFLSQFNYDLNNYKYEQTECGV